MNENFRIFQRTGVDVDNIGLAIGNPDFYGIPGRIYCQKYWIARSGERINSHIMSIYGDSVSYEGKSWLSYLSSRYFQTDDIQEIESELFGKNAIGSGVASYLRSMYECGERNLHAISRIREWILENGTKKQVSYMADRLRTPSVNGGTTYTSDSIRFESGNSPLSYDQVLEHASRRHNYYKDLEVSWKAWK